MARVRLLDHERLDDQPATGSKSAWSAGRCGCGRRNSDGDPAASTTQNDLVCAFWCLAVAYWVVAYVTERPAGGGQVWWWALWMGSALGLAIMSKPTAYLACAPFLLWLAIVAVRRDGFVRTAALAGFVAGQSHSRSRTAGSSKTLGSSTATSLDSALQAGTRVFSSQIEARRRWSPTRSRTPR